MAAVRAARGNSQGDGLAQALLTVPPQFFTEDYTVERWVVVFDLGLRKGNWFMARAKAACTAQTPCTCPAHIMQTLLPPQVWPAADS